MPLTKSKYFAGRKTTWIVLLVCFGLALLVRLVLLGSPALDIEEIITESDWGRQSFTFLLYNTLLDEGYPPVHFILTWPIRHLFGYGEFVLRIHSVLFGIGSLLIIYYWARQTGRRAAALTTTGLLTLCLYHVYWSQYARMYAMMIFFSAGLLWAVETVNSRSSGRHFFLLALFVYGTLGGHFFGLMPVAAAGAFLLIRFFESYRSDPAEVSQRFAVRLFLSLGVPIVLLWPWYSQMVLATLGVGQNYAYMKSAGATLPLNLDRLKSILGTYGFGTGGLIWVFAGLIVLGVGREIRKSQWRRLTFEFSWCALPFVVMALIPTSHFFDLSYTSASALVLWMWAGMGLAVAGAFLGRFVKFFRTGPGLVSLGLLASACIYSYPLSLYFQTGGKPGAIKDILVGIEGLAAEGQILIYEQNRDLNFIPLYYHPQKNIYFVYLKTPPGSSREQTVREFLEQNPAAWLVRGLPEPELAGWGERHFSRRIEFDNPPAVRLINMGIFPRQFSGMVKWVLFTGYQPEEKRNGKAGSEKEKGK